MTPKTFISVHQLAQQLGLPVAWLKVEAEGGRIPSLKIGRRLMFRLEDVEEALAQRARTNAGDDQNGGAA